MSDELVCIPENESERDENFGGYLAGNLIVVLFCETLVGLSLWFLWKFWKLREEKQFIYHRHPRLAAAIVIDSVPIIGILVPFASDLWSIECLTHYSAIIETPSQNAVQAIIIIAFVLFFFAWLFLVVLRVWLSRYDYEHKLATKYSFWQKDLGYTKHKNIELKTKSKHDEKQQEEQQEQSNEQQESPQPGEESNNEFESIEQKSQSSQNNHDQSDYYEGHWWIDKKKKYGEELPMIKILSCFYVPVVAIAVFASPIVFDGEWTAFVFWVGFCALVTCAFIAFNVWKVRQIHDNFHIRTEILLFAKVAMVIAVVMVLTYGVGRIWETELYHYATVLSGTILCALLFCITYISTRWVIDEHLRDVKKQEEYLLQNVNEDIEGNTTLKTVLGSKDGFEIFMNFLVSEYSTENLLCYVECTQFLRRWKHKINKLRKEAEQKQRVESAAVAGIASMTAIVTEQLHNEKLTKPQLKDEPSASQLEQAIHDVVIKPAKKALRGNDYSSSESDKSEDHFNMQDTEHNVTVDANAKHAMLNKFGFLAKPHVLKRTKLTFWDHFEYLHGKYVNKDSNRQINIRSALYKRFDRIKPEDCDIDNTDLATIPSHILSKSIGDGLGRSPTSLRERSLNSRTNTNRGNNNNNDNFNSNYSTNEHNNNNNNNNRNLPGGQPNISIAESNTVATTTAATNPDLLTRDVSRGDTLPTNTKKVSINTESNNISPVVLDSSRAVSLDIRKEGTIYDDYDENDNLSTKRPTTPSRSRRASRNLVGVAKVLKLIDDTRKELWKLMQDSFVRFRSTNEYVQYLQNLERNQSLSQKK